MPTTSTTRRATPKQQRQNAPPPLATITTTTSSSKANVRRPAPTPTRPRRPVRYNPPPEGIWAVLDTFYKFAKGLVVGGLVGSVVVVMLPWLTNAKDYVVTSYRDFQYDWQTYQMPHDWDGFQRMVWGDPSPEYVLQSKLKDNPYRVITLVHVGRAGGMSLQASTALVCKLKYTNNATQRDVCLQKHFGNIQSSPLALQTTSYFSLAYFQEDELRQATTFLVTLRNPVERVLSVWRDSHPLACQAYNDNDNNNNQQQRPWGCETEQTWQQPDTPAYQLYHTCFPTTSLESLAQAVQGIWDSTTLGGQRNPNTPPLSLPVEQQRACQWLARQVVQGKADISVAPHLHHNYEFYVSQSVRKYPTKEVMVVRTEHEYDDLMALDKSMGGTGRHINVQPDTANQVEHEFDAAISPVAYRKLCCVLHDELQLYHELLTQAVNMAPEQQQASWTQVLQKCGVSSTWEIWRIECQNQLENDKALFQQ